MADARLTRRKRVTGGILLLGFAAAVVLYVSAGVTATDLSGERPEDSKRYLRQMELYGGRANVLASQLREWFAGLWHGRPLAFTVAVLTVVFAGVAFFALTPLPPPGEPDGRPPGSRGQGRAGG